MYLTNKLYLLAEQLALLGSTKMTMFLNCFECQYTTIHSVYQQQKKMKSLHTSDRHHGRRGLLERGSDHEEAAAPQADSAVCRLHLGGAHLYNHRADDKWQPVGVPSK